MCLALAVASRPVITLYPPLLEPMDLTHPQYLIMFHASVWSAPRHGVPFG